MFPLVQATDGPGTNSQVLKGEVLMLTTDLVVVKGTEGTSTLVPLGKEATVDQTLKVGDHVEVRMRGTGEAETVTKAASQPSREPQLQGK
jgi:ribosomal protein S1